MITAALLQELGNNRLEPEIASLAAELGRRNIPCHFFNEKRLQRRQLPLSPATLVAGHIPIVLGALRQLGIPPPHPNDYPVSLRPWLHRRVWTSTVREIARKLHDDTTRPFFAKPFALHKRFRGRYVLESWSDLHALAGASDHAQVVCSDVVRWRTEYRVFVTRGQIVGTRHYLGDPAVSIDERDADQAVSAFESSGEAPRGYAVDFGVLDSGQTALIEVNDGYSLGAYGLADDLYTDLILARWSELMTGRVTSAEP